MKNSAKMNEKSCSTFDLTKTLLFLVLLVFSWNLSAQTESTCSKATEIVVKSVGTNSVTIGYILPVGTSKAYLDVVKYTTPVTDATVWTSKELAVPSTSTERGDLLPGTTYVFRIRTVCTNLAVNVTANRDFITTAATTSTCAAATNVSVSNITATSVKINFKLPADVASASLEIFPSNSTTAISKVITPLSATSVERLELTPSTKYTYKIKTTCANNVVNYSTLGDFATAAVPVTTATCSEATGLSVKSVGANGVKIGYTLPAGIGSATLLIVASISTPADAAVWLVKEIAPGSTYTERGDLLPSTKYFFKVKTVCTNGTVKYSSLGDFVTTAATAALPPCSPATNVIVSNITTNTATFNYTLPLGIGSATLEVIPANSIAWLTRNLSTTSTSYLRNELLIGTKYYYRIRTVCTNGTVSYTPEANFTTSGNKNGELTANDLSTQSGNDLTVNCFPNPATSGITVNILGGGGQMVNLQLSNIYGTVVYQSEFSQSEIQNINVGIYPRGIYILKVSVAGKTNSLKIVLN
jgi:2-keto-4-pentenoate hydratase